MKANEFEFGDVVCMNGTTNNLADFLIGNDLLSVIGFQTGLVDMIFLNDGKMKISVSASRLRHATPKEIKAERRLS